MQNSKLPTPSRILYPDILRTSAVIAVILIHICAFGFCNYDVNSSDWQIVNALKSLTGWAVPTFVMISGMFFLDPQKEISVSKLYRKNIFRLVVAIFFWGILYQIANIAKRIALENADPSVAVFEAIKELILGPAWYHLWFLYMMIGLYMLTPFFRFFTKNAETKHYRYLFILFISFGGILPLAQDFLLYTDHDFKIYFNLKDYFGYACYFIFGFFFSRYQISPKQKSIIYKIAIVSVFLQCIGTSLISCNSGQGNVIFYGNFSPNIIFQTIAIFLFIKEIGTKVAFSKKSSQIIGILGKYSFGIYLVHDFFNGIFYRIGFSTMDIPTILSIPLRMVFTFILSFLVVCALAKIPIIKKYCM